MQKESSSVISSRNDLQIKMKIRSPMTAEQLIEIDKRRQQGFNSLKNLKTLYEIKFYLCLPNLSREEKLLRSRNITENGGIIKVSISNAGMQMILYFIDYIVIHDEWIKSKFKLSKYFITLFLFCINWWIW